MDFGYFPKNLLDKRGVMYNNNGIYVSLPYERVKECKIDTLLLQMKRNSRKHTYTCIDRRNREYGIFNLYQFSCTIADILFEYDILFQFLSYKPSKRLHI